MRSVCRRFKEARRKPPCPPGRGRRSSVSPGGARGLLSSHTKRLSGGRRGGNRWGRKWTSLSGSRIESRDTKSSRREAGRRLGREGTWSGSDIEELLLRLLYLHQPKSRGHPASLSRDSSSPSRGVKRSERGLFDGRLAAPVKLWGGRLKGQRGGRRDAR